LLTMRGLRGGVEMGNDTLRQSNTSSSEIIKVSSPSGRALRIHSNGISRRDFLGYSSVKINVCLLRL